MLYTFGNNIFSLLVANFVQVYFAACEGGKKVKY